MVNVERSFVADAPLARVHEYLKDFSTPRSGTPGTLTCTRIDRGPIQVGAQWRNVSVFRGRKTELSYRLTRLAPGRLTFVGTNKTATSTDDLSLTSTPFGTSILYRATITFHGVAKLAGPFLNGEFTRLGDEIVISMPAALERRRD